MTAADREPFKLVRALLLTVPLAILVGAVVAPPDPIAAMAVMVAALAAGVPLAVRLVDLRRYGPLRIGVFFALVFVIVVVGLWGVSRLGRPAGLPRTLLRLGVVVVALLLADFLLFRVSRLGGD
ncbi:MAG: hypothetical protein ABEI31_01015 [Halodesulfurarchaeum sp.]